MKILLTGLNRSGKTTLLLDIVKNIQPRHGVLAKEVRVEGDRIGFDLVDEHGRSAVLSRVDMPTNFPVGRYFVDVGSLERFIDQLDDYSEDDLLFVDEIGQMQLCSNRFKEMVRILLDAKNDYVGTVTAVFEDPFVDEVKSREDVLLCIVTPENRDALKPGLSEALANRSLFGRLALGEQREVLALARHYLQIEQYTSLRKLFHNALRYVAERRVTQAGASSYVAAGDHGDYTVEKTGHDYRCTCDFSNGRGEFEGNAGECSHVQAVKILSANMLAAE